MTFKYRFAFPALLTAAFTAGCSSGSPATVGGPGPVPSGAAGTPTATGGSSPTGMGGSSPTGTGGASAMGGTPATGTGGASGSGAGGASSAGASGAAGSSGSGGGGPVTTVGINSGAGPWGTPVAGGPAASGTMVTGTVTVSRGTANGTVGAGYLGFSVEKTHLTNSTITGTNAPLIALFNLIGPASLRVGANDVELCSWTPATPPAGGGPPYGKKIGTAMVDELNDFLNATKAKVIYALNFSLNTPANDAAEATYASMKLGSNLYGFEIGNELNKYGTWPTQKTQYETIADSVIAAVPNIRLVGPASTASGGDFTTAFAKDEATKLGSKLVQLVGHYYLGGAGTATVSTLQTVKSDMPGLSKTMSTAVSGNHIAEGYRYDEANTFYNHGQMGVSDTLVASLWSLDLLFVSATNGASGVNFHGGETGMDGTSPFYYEPIQENLGVVQAVMPVYYGMLLFYLAGQGSTLATTVTSSNANFTAYAIDYKADGSTSVVLDNKNASTGVQVTVDVGTAVTSASAIYLQGTAAGLTAPSVTLAGAAVTPQGAWARNPPFIQTTSGNTVSVFVPPASAALVRVQ